MLSHLFTCMPPRAIFTPVSSSSTVTLPSLLQSPAQLANAAGGLKPTARNKKVENKLDSTPTATGTARACVRACVRACERACVRACVKNPSQPSCPHNLIPPPPARICPIEIDGGMLTSPSVSWSRADSMKVITEEDYRNISVNIRRCDLGSRRRCAAILRCSRVRSTFFGDCREQPHLRRLKSCGYSLAASQEPTPSSTCEAVSIVTLPASLC
jgi:hypothetical protein